MNLRQAKSLKTGTVLHYTGESTCEEYRAKKREPRRFRVTGSVQEWKRNPERVKVPIKRGLNEYGYMDETNLHNFHLESECPLLQASEDYTEDDDSQDPEPDDDYTEPIPFPVPTEAVERDPSWLASHMDQLMEESIRHESTSPGLPLVPMSFSADQIRYFTTIDIPGAPVSASKFANLNAVYRFETSGLDSVAITIAVPLKEVDHLAMALVRWVTFSSTRIQE